MDRDHAGKLLVIEDENILRRLVAQFLRTEKFEVVEAADGVEGVGAFHSRGPFDLVLLDLNLPRLPGVEVWRRIKAAQPSQPVIICSAAILDDHIAELRGMNVQRFLTKPCHPLDLLSQVVNSIERFEGSRLCNEESNRTALSV